LHHVQNPARKVIITSWALQLKCYSRVVSTRRQKAANRQNSRKSKGPVTPEGKAVSSENATRHGLLATKSVLLPTEDPAAFEGFRDKIHAQLTPVGDLEAALAERIVVALWKLRRLELIETGLLTSQYYDLMAEYAEQKAESFTVQILSDLEEQEKADTMVSGRTEITKPLLHRRAMEEAQEFKSLGRSEVPTLGRVFVRSVTAPDPLSKLQRYHSALERTFYMALHELQRIQAARQQGQSVPAPAALDVTFIPAPVAEEDSARKFRRRRSTEG
jgi:hypothetical protein